MPAGRPTKYEASYIVQAEKLCALGATDIEVADFFEVMPDEEEWLAYCLKLIREDRNGVIALQKQKRAIRRKKAALKPGYRITNAMRARIWSAIKGKSNGLTSRLGYSQEGLMAHLESHFQEGMKWSNYGKWHVDHKKPCALYDLTDKTQFDECWSLNNLQPLWAADNIKKGAKYGSP